MPHSNTSVENVLPQLLSWLQSGQRICLATLYHSYGTSPRPVGSQMAIAEDGRWFGYLSGGCAERAIASEGVAAIKQVDNHSVRYGVGSPYLDIQLPCGAGIDVWFDQSIEEQLVQTIVDNVSARTLTGLECEAQQGGSAAHLISPVSSMPSSSFRRWYTPSRRLYIIGSGPAVAALAVMAREADYSVEVLTPDQQTLDDVKRSGVQVSLFRSQLQIESLATDVWTCAVLMFHEHERETEILTTLLNTEVFYIGALGSARTHNIRLDLLSEAGVTSVQCARIHGPVGLAIQAMTPTEIAISVLGELTLEYRKAAGPLLEWGGSELDT